MLLPIRSVRKHLAEILFTVLAVLAVALFAVTISQARPVTAPVAAFDSTFNHASYVMEGASYLTYSGAIDMTGNTTGSHYTQALYIGDANQDTAFVRLVCSNVAGTEDVDVFVEFSNDLLTWDVVSTAMLLQLSTTAVYDTMNVVHGVARIEFRNSTWMRIRFDGQSGNPATTVSWYAYLPKNSGVPATIPLQSKVRNRRTS